MLPRSNANARVPIRLSIGDGLRFGIGFVLAPLALWLIFCAIGLSVAELLPKLFPPTTANAAPK